MAPHRRVDRGSLSRGRRALTREPVSGFGAAVLCASIRIFGRRSASRLDRGITAAIAIATLAALVVDAAYFGGRARTKVWLDYLPLGLLSQTWHFAAAIRTYGTKIDISRKAYQLHEANRDLVFAFVIGESVRSRNFSLNGYARQTNPALERMPNLVSFPHATSAATTTRKSVPVMITRITAAAALPLMTSGETWHDISVPETSFISIFNRLGFATSFLANWSQYGPWATTETIFAEEAAYTWFSNSWRTLSDAQHAQRLTAFGVRDVVRFDQGYDENLLFILDHRIAAAGGGRSLIVMHPYGSHFSYTQIPPEFRRFTPVCDLMEVAIADCGPSLVNAYDNTILYADWFLAEVIRRLQGRNAVLLYVGDHGESLGEEGYYLHSHDLEWEKHVPLIVWASDRFLADPINRAKFAALRANRNRQVTHDFIFHTTLDLAGIESEEVLRPALSLCRESVAPFIPVHGVP